MHNLIETMQSGGVLYVVEVDGSTSWIQDSLHLRSSKVDAPRPHHVADESTCRMPSRGGRRRKEKERVRGWGPALALILHVSKFMTLSLCARPSALCDRRATYYQRLRDRRAYSERHRDTIRRPDRPCEKLHIPASSEKPFRSS